MKNSPSGFIILVLLTIVSLLGIRCARVGSPVGGAKDSIPPKALSLNIDSSLVKIPTSLKELRIDFDEYVTLKDISKSLIISPPIKNIKKIFPSNLATKFVSIQWADTLQENTTYNFNFGNAIRDFNEGNILPYFQVAFSTGDQLDERFVSGIIKSNRLFDAKKVSEKQLIFALYKGEDIPNLSKRPDYLSPADPEDGYFEINYLAPGKYRWIAFRDDNGDSLADPGEPIDFGKESIDVSQNIKGIPVQLLSTKANFRFKENQPIPGGFQLVFDGITPDIDLASVSPLSQYQVSKNLSGDTLKVYLPEEDVIKSQLLKIQYKVNSKTDSLKFTYRPAPVNTAAKGGLTLKNISGAKLAPKSRLKIQSDYDLKTINTSGWSLKKDSSTVQEPFTAVIDSLQKNEIVVDASWNPDTKYSLTIPANGVESFYTGNKSAYRFDFQIGKLEDYGRLMIKINASFLTQNSNSGYFLQLLDSEGNIKYSKYTRENSVIWGSLQPGRYTLRLLADINASQTYDFAEYSKQSYAEPIYLYENGVEIKPLWDSTLTWEITENQENNTSSSRSK